MRFLTFTTFLAMAALMQAQDEYALGLTELPATERAKMIVEDGEFINQARRDWVEFSKGKATAPMSDELPELPCPKEIGHISGHYLSMQVG